MTSSPGDIPEPTGPSPFQPIKLNNLAVKIAETREEIEEAQRLRFRIFCGDMGAKPSEEEARLGRDFDHYDAVCDHLLVLHYPEEGSKPEIVGTYRLLRQERMESIGAFYTESEFDISALKANGGHLMELGRSCTDPDFRSRAVMQLLWRGIGEYVTYYKVDLMFGCASFHGADAALHREGLSFLHHFHQAPEALRARALDDLYVDMNLADKDSIDQKKAFLSLPVLLKGYLRLGGVIGDGAVYDPVFNTTDVCIVVKTDLVGEKYASKYTPDNL